MLPPGEELLAEELCLKLPFEGEASDALEPCRLAPPLPPAPGLLALDDRGVVLLPSVAFGDGVLPGAPRAVVLPPRGVLLDAPRALRAPVLMWWPRGRAAQSERGSSDQGRNWKTTT